MLLFYEAKKLISNRAIAFISLILLALTALAALNGAARAKMIYIDAEEAKKEYAAFADETVRTASTALKASRGDFTSSYYAEVVERYRAAKESTVFESGDITGWDELIRLDLPLFTGLFVSILLGAAAFYEDARLGMSGVILASKRGRGYESGGRLAAAVILSLLFLTASTLISFLCFKTAGLLQNGGFSLQSAPSFAHSEAELSLTEAYITVFFRRCLVMAAVTAAACFFAKLITGYVHIILALAVFPVLEFALFSVRYSAVDVFVKNVNLFAYGSSYLLERFYCVRLFGMAYPESVTTAALIAAGLVFSGLCVLVPERRKGSVKRGLRVLYKPELPLPPARGHSLFSWEFIKLLHSPAILLPVCLCVVLGIAGILKNSPVKVNDGERLYRSYCEQYVGHTLDEVSALLDGEETRILAGAARIDEADRLFEQGSMTDGEYQQIFNEYMSCLIAQGMLPSLRARLDALTEAASGLSREPEFVYDTGYKKLLGADANIFLSLAAVLTACTPFLGERSSGFSLLARSYRNGRKKLYLTRLLYVCAGTVTVFVLFSLAELFALGNDGIFESLQAPSASLDKLIKLGELPIGASLIMMYAMRLAALLCAALITLGLSARFESPIVVLVPASGWLLISLALRKLGVSFLPVDLSAFVSGSAALISSGVTAWLGILPTLALTVFGIMYSYRKYVDN